MRDNIQLHFDISEDENDIFFDKKSLDISISQEEVFEEPSRLILEEKQPQTTDLGQ